MFLLRCRLSLVALVVSIVGTGAASGQLLHNQTPLYENYGVQGYRQYGRGLVGRSTEFLYDELGEFLMDGVEIYSLQEDRGSPNAPTGSNLSKHHFYWGYLGGLAIGSDQYKNWSTRLLVGDHIRTRFTPLTLDLAALNGIRWDVDAAGQRTSLVLSRRDRPIWTILDNVANQEQVYATYLLGGHWETDVGPFEVGATYTNQYRVDSGVGLEWNDLKGATPTSIQAVQLLVIKFANAEERKGSSVRVFDVRLSLNGEPSGIQPVVTRHDAEVVNPRYPNYDRFYPEWQSVPPFVEFIQGAFAHESPGRTGYIQADDTQYLLYWFELPEDVEIQQASFDALVAGNYDIYASEVFIQVPYVSKQDPGTRNRVTYFYRVQGVEQGGGDTSNLRCVHFDYGRQTGNAVFGAHARADVKGFRFRGECNANLNHLQYPNPQGYRHTRKGIAFFVNVEKALDDHVTVGGECFSISPEYSTKITVHDEGYDSYTSLPWAPFANELGATFRNLYNNTIEMDAVDDNDDKDPFPDFYFIPSESDNDGIFPGLDEDLDGRPDINENDNELPDYVEPFLLYDVDPEGFVYGDDLNNNGVIDVREDDRKPDYPYDQNLQGWNLFVRWTPLRQLALSLGRYDTRQIWGGGRSQSSYVKLEYEYDYPTLAKIRVTDFLKRVEDNIPNDVYRFTHSSTGFETVFYEDPLRMENSLVNTASAEFELHKYRPFECRIQVLHEINRQGPTALRGRNWIRHWAMVLRNGYTWRVGRFTVMPRIKFMAQKTTDSEGEINPLHELFFYPILRADYDITSHTALRAGAQGFPFLESQYTNLEEDTGYASQDYTVALSNTSSYSGYQMGLSMGYNLRVRRMEDRRRLWLDEDYTFFFIRLVVGLQPTM